MSMEAPIIRRASLAPAVVITIGLGLAATFCSAQATKSTAPAATSSDEKVVATVDGVPITQKDVMAKSQNQFDAVEAQFNQCKTEYERNKHDVLENSVQQVVQDQVVSAEAKARGVSEDDLMKEIKPATVTDAEVDAFYEQNKARIGQPKDKIAPQIKQYLEQQARAEAFKGWYSELEKKHKVKMNVEPLRTEVAATGPAKGPANAPVTIVEFSDFQCPFCARIIPSLQQVEKNYGDKVRIVFRQFPLNIHPQAEKAAEAALCANEQGKFWAMHDAMFGNQSALQPENLVAKAGELGIDKDKFKTCLDSAKYSQQIQEDQKAGLAAGVNGTPTIFINGRYMSGAVPYDQIASVIDEELARGSGK